MTKRNAMNSENWSAMKMADGWRSARKNERGETNTDRKTLDNNHSMPCGYEICEWQETESEGTDERPPDWSVSLWYLWIS